MSPRSNTKTPWESTLLLRMRAPTIVTTPSARRISALVRFRTSITCWMLCRLTPELSHAGPRTQANPRLPGKPDGLPGVGSSALVRRRGHNLKNLRPTLRPRRDGRPCRGTSKSKQKTGRQARPKISSDVAKEKTHDRRPTSAAWPNPLCAFAPLRLCVENGRQSKRKGAKTPSRNQSNGVTLAAEHCLD